MHFGIGKVVTRRVKTYRTCRTARRDTLVTTSATRSTRVQGRRQSMDWDGHVHPAFSRSCSWDLCKSRAKKTKLVHASTTASSSSARLKQVRLDTLVTSYASRRVETWRDKPSGMWAIRSRSHTLAVETSADWWRALATPVTLLQSRLAFRPVGPRTPFAVYYNQDRLHMFGRTEVRTL